MSTIFQGLLNMPGLLLAWAGEQGTLFRGAIAASFDLASDHATAIRRARSPLLCDATVLPYHARDRRIRQYRYESEISHRKRLAKWHQIWASSGRAWGILRQLRIYLSPFGRPTIRYVSTSSDGAESQWHTLAPGDGTRDYFAIGGPDPEFSTHRQTPANWLWDAYASTGGGSRFWIIVELDGVTSGLADAGQWDGASLWDGTNVWDGGFPATITSDIVDLCNEWKVPNSQLQGVLYTRPGYSFSPSGTASTVMPWGYTTYPNGSWDNPTKRNPNVIYAYTR